MSAIAASIFPRLACTAAVAVASVSRPAAATATRRESQDDDQTEKHCLSHSHRPPSIQSPLGATGPVTDHLHCRHAPDINCIPKPNGKCSESGERHRPDADGILTAALTAAAHGMVRFKHEKAVLFLDLARGKSALFSVSEPVLGAMLATGTIPSLRVCLLGVLAALAGYLCVYSLNDLLDLRADREEIRVSSPDPLAWKPEVPHMDVMTLRHPVAAGALPLWAAIDLGRACWGSIGLAAAYLLRPLCAYLFVGCAALGDHLLQPAPPAPGSKSSRPRTMVAVGGLAGWFAVGEATWGALAFFFLLFGWETGRNLTNDLADVMHDRLVGITTLASTHGPRGGGEGDPRRRRGDGGHLPGPARRLGRARACWRWWRCSP